MSVSTIASIQQVRVLGRHVAKQHPLTLFYTAAGIECLFTGSELWIQLNADYNQVEPWVSVELNGAWISRFPVNKGESEICLFRGMTPGTQKHIRVLKDVQAMNDDPAHLLQITGLRYEDGEFLPLPEPKYRLEFVGNSITSGEGTIGAKQEEDWIGAFFSAVNHYARMTSDALGAEYRIVSQSGWGLVSGWDNNPNHVVMPYYPQVCGLITGPRNAALGAGQLNDFDCWKADAVIINLGTNDCGAMHNPPWQDPVTGQVYQQTDTPQGHAVLEQTVVATLKTLRSLNPGAKLVWAFGMLGDQIRPILEGSVNRYRTETGDTDVFYLPLPEATPETLGARQHPGVACHRQAAEVLTGFLQSILT